MENTGNALKDLAKQVAELRGRGEDVGNCYAVRINSGKFGVEWQETKAVLEAGDLEITVVRPEEEDNADSAGAAAAKGNKPPTADGTKDKTSLDKHVVGVKRKRQTGNNGDQDSDRENTTKQAARLHPGIAKRRKKLGLDG